MADLPTTSPDDEESGMRRLPTFALIGLALAGAARAETHEVGQKGRAFAPAALSLKPGDSVTFVNDDDIAHNVLSETPGHAFDLKLQRPGEAKRVTFDKPGTIEIGCDIHPRMQLTITVR